ncbi:MAG TPA: hypothetical protein VF855_06210 [Acidimicrobiales bacterium]
MSDAVYQDENGTWRNEYGEEVLPPDARHTEADFAHTGGDIGSWDDGSGGVDHGVKGEAEVFHYQSTDTDAYDTTVDVLQLTGTAHSGDHGYGVSAQANIVSVSQTSGDWDPNQAGESRITYGGSLGVGAAVEVTDGSDMDNDGRPEYGATVSLGPVTAGYAYEDAGDGELPPLPANEGGEGAPGYYDGSGQGGAGGYSGDDGSGGAGGSRGG